MIQGRLALAGEEREEARYGRRAFNKILKQSRVARGTNISFIEKLSLRDGAF